LPDTGTVSTKVGIIGSGIVGQTLANGFVKHGYDVTLGTNTASKREELKAKTKGKANVGSFEDAAKFGEVVVLATKGTAAEAALKAAGIPISSVRPSSTPRTPSPMRLR
jgi:predicted dinucleotide-binding enzyme